MPSVRVGFIAESFYLLVQGVEFANVVFIQGGFAKNDTEMFESG